MIALSNIFRELCAPLAVEISTLVTPALLTVTADKLRFAKPAFAPAAPATVIPLALCEANETVERTVVIDWVPDVAETAARPEVPVSLLVETVIFRPSTAARETAPSVRL